MTIRLNAILIPFLVLSLAGLGLNLLTGYTGQTSVGAAGFMAVGAFADLRISAALAGAGIAAGIAGRRDYQRLGRPVVRVAQLADQRLLPDGHHTGRAVFLGMAVRQIPVVLQLRIVRDYRRAETGAVRAMTLIRRWAATC